MVIRTIMKNKSKQKNKNKVLALKQQIQDLTEQVAALKLKELEVETLQEELDAAVQTQALLIHGTEIMANITSEQKSHPALKKYATLCKNVVKKIVTSPERLVESIESFQVDLTKIALTLPSPQSSVSSPSSSLDTGLQSEDCNPSLMGSSAPVEEDEG